METVRKTRITPQMVYTQKQVASSVGLRGALKESLEAREEKLMTKKGFRHL